MTPYSPALQPCSLLLTKQLSEFRQAWANLRWPELILSFCPIDGRNGTRFTAAQRNSFVRQGRQTAFILSFNA
jgi:hypothetical protein